MMPWNNAHPLPVALPLIGQRVLRFWMRLVQVPLSLRAYLYEDAGELIEPEATTRSLIAILIPTLTLLVTESLVAFAVVSGVALLLSLYQIRGALTLKRRIF